MRSIALATALAATMLPVVPALAAPDANAGKSSYDAMCKACHTTAIAPPLKGVTTRQIAGNAQYKTYSPALQARKKDRWTDAHLNAYLSAPTKFAPGTKMMSAVPDATVRANIIAYLKTLK